MRLRLATNIIEPNAAQSKVKIKLSKTSYSSKFQVPTLWDFKSPSLLFTTKQTNKQYRYGAVVISTNAETARRDGLLLRHRRFTLGGWDSPLLRQRRTPTSSCQSPKRFCQTAPQEASRRLALLLLTTTTPLTVGVQAQSMAIGMLWECQE
ncbi:hypothetical protein CMV_016167 [Castanea mollissima]|uniref:Uncharacterized protein n=1 Tax=Castanea mollissima TaxID=60419 RepID=A0A8J4VRY7_9ROSI|nr:hypothetical protein CMV_016167 [Castanea mollissima]